MFKNNWSGKGFIDSVEYLRNTSTAKTYCEYIGSKVNKSNYGCEHGECKSCIYKKDYKNK